MRERRSDQGEGFKRHPKQERRAGAVRSGRECGEGRDEEGHGDGKAANEGKLERSGVGAVVLVCKVVSEKDAIGRVDAPGMAIDQKDLE